jgi:hypothetical protein
MPNFYNTDEARRYFTDALIVFKSICKLCLKDVPNQGGASSFGIGSLGGGSSMMNTFTMRSKILGLELILAVVERPGTTFLNSKEFVTIIKDTLCDGLLSIACQVRNQYFPCHCPSSIAFSCISENI